jgi:predicted nucleotidyltransferase
MSIKDPVAPTLPLSEAQLAAITAACQQHHVARLYLFGSLLRPDYRPGESDIDLLVEFQPAEPAVLYKTYFSLLNELRQSLAAPIDLVMDDAIRNPYLQASIEASKRMIYAA